MLHLGRELWHMTHYDTSMRGVTTLPHWATHFYPEIPLVNMHINYINEWEVG